MMAKFQHSGNHRECQIVHLSNHPPAEPEAFAVAGPSKGPDRPRQGETPHPITPSPLFPLPWGEGRGGGELG